MQYTMAYGMDMGMRIWCSTDRRKIVYKGFQQSLFYTQNLQIATNDNVQQNL